MRRIAAALALLLLGGCAETQLLTHAAKQVTGGSDKGVYKVGKPYQVFGVWYYPKEDPTYDEVGIASWYGPGFQGLRTANGEVFDMNELTAAHTTLPMPSYVRVTNLGNGRALVLKVNDRGPFVAGRIIDVSRRAAQLLGFYGQGTAKVRVQAVAAPDEGDDAILVAEAEAISTIDAQPVALVAAEPVAGGGASDSLAIFVQAGAFADPANAEATRRRIAGFGSVGVNMTQSDVGALWRVRLGPYGSREEAALALGRVWGIGLTGARLVTD
jgi:rare lipoprotein A